MDARLTIRITEAEKLTLARAEKMFNVTASEWVRLSVMYSNKFLRKGEGAMHSFYDINGKRVIYERSGELAFDVSRDVVSGKITGYFVYVNDYQYEVDEKNYEALNPHYETE